MAFATAEDMYSSVNITMFGTVYQSYRHLLQNGAVLLINGRVTEREDRPYEVLCDRISPIDETVLNSISALQKDKTVYIKVKSINAPEVAEVLKILKQNRGNSTVTLYSEDTKKKFSPPDNIKISCEDAVIEKLMIIVGNNNVKTVE